MLVDSSHGVFDVSLVGSAEADVHGKVMSIPVLVHPVCDVLEELLQGIIVDAEDPGMDGGAP